MNVEDSWRDLSLEERQVIERLLRPPFTGRDELLEQLIGAKARTVDEDGSLSIQVTSPVQAPIPVRVPVTALAKDEDGVPLQLLIHVVDGRLYELELWRVDLAALKRWPTAGAIDSVSLDPEVSAAQGEH